MAQDERGSTLVGELIALAIVGTALVALLSGLSTSSLGVRVVDRRVSAENLARSQIEAIEEAAYQPNPTAVPYPSIAAQAGYSLSVDVSYWMTATGTFTTNLPLNDGGLQRIRVEVRPSAEPDALTFALEGYKGDRP